MVYYFVTKSGWVMYKGIMESIARDAAIRNQAELWVSKKPVTAPFPAYKDQRFCLQKVALNTK